MPSAACPLPVSAHPRKTVPMARLKEKPCSSEAAMAASARACNSWWERVAQSTKQAMVSEADTLNT